MKKNKSSKNWLYKKKKDIFFKKSKIHGYRSRSAFKLIEINDKKMKLLELNELKLIKFKDHYLRLKLIFERTIDLIDEFNPDEIAIEAPFFGKNVQSMLKLGRAQGVATAAGLSREVPVTEYSPKKIKMAITGNGNASKEQVAKMLQGLFKI